jgi:hypothetical protein
MADDGSSSSSLSSPSTSSSSSVRTAALTRVNRDGELAGFDTFWKEYPKKVGKDDARRAWGKRRPDAELQMKILAALDWQRQQDEWLREAGRFIPNPATWLTQGRWQDEPSTTPRVNDSTLALARAAQGFLK